MITVLINLSRNNLKEQLKVTTFNSFIHVPIFIIDHTLSSSQKQSIKMFICNMEDYQKRN